MNEHEIWQAFDRLKPTPEAKGRMLQKICSAASAERKPYKVFAQKRKGSPLIAAIVLLVFAVGLGALYFHSALNRTPTQLGDGEGEQTLAGDVITTNLDYLDLTLIEPILDKYRSVILQGGDLELCEEAGISTLIMHVTSPDHLGYDVRDLDENGSIELIITDGNVIFDLYSLSGREFVHVFSGWERNSYELCEGNFIRNIASGGAADTVYTFSKLQGTDLVWYDKVIYDGADVAGPWFFAHYMVSMTRIPVDEDTACGMIAEHPVTPIEFVPIIEVITHEYLMEENDEQYLILPLSGTAISVPDGYKDLLTKVDVDLLRKAEESLTSQISEYPQHSGYYLEAVDGGLYLSVEVIVDLDPPESFPPVSGEPVLSGCGIDHEHKFFSEPITYP